MNLYPLVKTRQVRKFYNHNRTYILAVVFIAGFIIGFVIGQDYQVKQIRQAILNFTESSIYEKQTNTNTFKNSEVDNLLDYFGLDH